MARANPEEAWQSFPVKTTWYDGSTSGVSTATVKTYRRIWSGGVTPNFRRVRRRDLPVNNHSVYMYNIQDNGYYYEYNDENFASGAYSHASIDSYFANRGRPETGAAPSEPQHNTAIRNSAISKLIGAAGQNVNNVAQDFAQYGLVVQMVGDTAKRIAGSVNDLRHGNIPGAVDKLWQSSKPRFKKGKVPSQKRTLADNWLCLQYGWKPLLGNIRGVAESVAKYNLANSVVQKVQSSDQVTTKTRSPLWCNFTGFPPCGYLTKVKTTNCRFILRYRLADPMLAFLNQTGFTNPISLAWEVLPWSFVVDWFLPIGQFLEQLTSFQGLEFIDGCETWFTRETSFHDTYYNGPSGIPDPDPKVKVTLVGNMVVEAIKLDRTKLYTFPGMTLPAFKNPLSVAHGLNGLALLTQAFGRR